MSKAESTKKHQKHQAASSRHHQRRPIADTTSEDEMRGQKDKRSGTLDSAPIDRAKSFEYFPGESTIEERNAEIFFHYRQYIASVFRSWKYFFNLGIAIS